MINSFDSKEKEENQVNSFAKRSTVCYALIELICIECGGKSVRGTERETGRVRVEVEKKWQRRKVFDRIMLALIGLFKLRLKKVKNRTPVMYLKAGYDEKSRVQYVVLCIFF